MTEPSEKIHTAEVHTVDPEVKTTPAETSGPTPAKIEIKAGLTIGIAADGGFIFRILGKEPSLPELEGIIKYAEIVLDDMVKKQIGLSNRGPISS